MYSMGLLKRFRNKREEVKKLEYIRGLALKYIHVLRYDEKAIEAEQKKLLTDLLLYAKAHSLYYKELLSGVDITEKNCINVIANLPLSSKEIIRRHSPMIYSDEIGADWQGWLNTGGSTGEPLHFPIKIRGVDIEQVHQMMLYLDMGWKFKDIIVSIDGSVVDDSLRSKNIFYVEGNNFPYGKYSFSTLYMSNETLSFYIRDLNVIKPSILRGYPSGLMRLANYIIDFNCRLSFSLKGIYLTSECFSVEDGKILQDVFRCKIYGQYGHTESSIFAVSKDCSSYFCSPFYGFTEVVDDQGCPVSPGEVGEVVVTGFLNIAMPFIRYKTGDIAEYGGKKDGITVLNSLNGRTVDCIINKFNQKIYLTGLIFGGHIKALNHINDWQIEQSEVGKIIIKVVKGVGFNDQISQELVLLFNENLIDVEMQFVDYIPVTRRGKRKFMIQHLNI